MLSLISWEFTLLLYTLAEMLVSYALVINFFESVALLDAYLLASFFNDV